MADLMRGDRPGMMIAMHRGVIVPHRTAMARVIVPGGSGNRSCGKMRGAALPPRRPAGEEGDSHNPDNRSVKPRAHCVAE